MKKIISRLFVLLLLFTGCQDDWSDYYKDSEGGETDASGATANLLEQLKSVPEYSEFVKLLEATKVSEELTRNQVLTVWVPTNATMPAEVATMSEKDKITLCKNHINYVALYNTKLTDGKVIKTLAGKNLTVKESGTDHFSFDGQEVTKLNQKCTNGVIHELGGWLIPRKNIFEYILESGPEYSIIRDSLLARCDTVFKPGLSFPLGVDELGNTIYDSVFVIENSLLEYKSDIRSEDEDFTMFLPTDQSIHNMYEEMEDYFKNTGSYMTNRDSVKFFGWLLRSIIHQGKIENYTGTFTSPYGYEWRTNYQLVASGEYKSFSNGYVYEVSKIHIPKFMYLTSVRCYATYLSELPDDKINDYLTMGNVTSFNLKQSYDGHTIVQVLGNKSEPVAWYEFKTITKDLEGNLIDAKISPGLYTVNASYRTYLCGNLRLSFNGEEVATYNASNSKFSYKPGEIFRSYEVKEEWGFNMISIKQEDIGKAGRLMLEYIEFIPTDENY